MKYIFKTLDTNLLFNVFCYEWIQYMHHLGIIKNECLGGGGGGGGADPT